MAEMCAKLIRRRGHLPLIAGSSHDALSIVRDMTDIDVVISDIQMPEMTGVQLLGRLHAIDERLPVVLMTGYANLISPAQIIALGAVDCLMKPFDADALIGTLERATRSRHNVTPN
jgi:DNA-binding NtrC family response regulator